MTCDCDELGCVECGRRAAELAGLDDEAKKVWDALYCLLHPAECADEGARRRVRKLKEAAILVGFAWLIWRDW